MLTAIHPKLPMRDKAITKQYYIGQLGFHQLGTTDYDGYLMIQKDDIEIHFFEYKELNPADNYGHVYIRTNNIDKLHQFVRDHEIAIHPAGALEIKPWGQREFSLVDPDNNLITFGQPV